MRFIIYFRNACLGCRSPFIRDFRNAAEATWAPVPAVILGNYVNERCGPVKKFIAAGTGYPGGSRYVRDSKSATALPPLPECDAFHERRWDSWAVVAWMRSSPCSGFNVIYLTLDVSTLKCGVECFRLYFRVVAAGLIILG